MQTEPTFTMTVDADALAPPGISGDLWSVQTRPGTSEAETHELLADQTERDFEVRCVCTCDSEFTRDISAQVTLEAGTSFFQVPNDTKPGFLYSQGLRFEVVCNAKGEIGGFRTHVRAKSPREARSRFANALTPVLDHLAYAANTPLAVSPPSVHDIKNLVWVFGYTSPYLPKVVNPGTMTLFAELAPVYGLYREAKNTFSPFYRFLCYFKILEGLYENLRPTLFAKARTLGVTLTTQKEVLPDHPELRRFQPELIGRSVKDYVDNVLRKQFRDAVAHFILESGRILSPSDPEAIDAFANVLFSAELCCQVGIAQHERYLSELNHSQKSST